jgi:hypothetical protein
MMNNFLGNYIVPHDGCPACLKHEAVLVTKSWETEVVLNLSVQPGDNKEIL